MSRARQAEHPDRVFHHPDPIHTPLLDWAFMAFAVLAILVGLPVAIGATFHYVVPALGKLFTP